MGTHGQENRNQPTAMSAMCQMYQIENQSDIQFYNSFLFHSEYEPGSLTLIEKIRLK